MKKLTLSFGHSQTCDLMMVMGAGWPIDLITYGHVPGCDHGTMPNGYAKAPPMVEWQLGASPLMETHSDCRT